MEAGYHVQTFPVPEHRTWMSSRTPESDDNDDITRLTPRMGVIPQSLATLPKLYKTDSRATLSNKDPISALHRVFLFFVASEAYCLSFMASQINQHSSLGRGAADVADTEGLSNLLHCQQLLERHIDELRYARRIVKGWRLPNPDPENVHTILTRDLEYLVERALTLKNRAETSINLSMSIASIDEARRSVQQNTSVFRFTVIASIYVPLSFVATVFGMNFRQFGQGNLSIWIYFVVSIPVFIVSAFVIFVNPQALWRAIYRIKVRRS